MRKTRDPMRRARSRKGETFVESTLVFLLLVLTIVGILDLGQILLFHQSLRARARAGVRYAVVSSYDPQKIKNMVVYNTAAAPPGSTSGLFGLTPSMVTVTRYDEGTADDRIEVVISNHPMAFLSPFLVRTSLRPVFRATLPVQSLGASD